MVGLVGESVSPAVAFMNSTGPSRGFSISSLKTNLSPAGGAAVDSEEAALAAALAASAIDTGAPPAAAATTTTASTTTTATVSVQLKWPVLQVRLSLQGASSLSEEAKAAAAARFAGVPPLSKKDVLAEIRAKATPEFQEEHMADMKSWTLASAAKSISMERLADLCVPTPRDVVVVVVVVVAVVVAVVAVVVVVVVVDSACLIVHMSRLCVSSYPG